MSQHFLKYRQAAYKMLKRLSTMLSNESPGTQISLLIRQTAVKEWRLLAMNMLSNLILAISEGFTFVVIFQAARLLSGDPDPHLFHWISHFAPFADVMTALNRGQLFILLLLLAITLQLLMSLARYCNGLSVGWFAARCQGRILPILHRYLLSLSYECASRYRVGHLISIASRAPQAVQLQIIEKELFISNLLLLFVYLVALLLLNPWLSIVAATMAAAIASLHRTLSPRIRKASRQQIEVNRQMAVRMTEDLQLLRLLHSSAALRSSENRIEVDARKLERHMIELTWLTPLLEPVSDLMPVLAAAMIGGLSWFLYQGNGQLLVPNLVTLVLIIQRLNIRLARMGSSLNRLSENTAAMQEVETILNPADKVFRRTGGLPFTRFTDRIELCKVSLRYPDRQTYSLRDVNLQLPVGANVALVGESGSGKSSLIDLLVGLYQPTNGIIRVDGVDLERLDLDSWQRQLGVVSQDVLLINGSIKDNIAFSSPDATAEQIAAASRAADAESFILNLPDQYDTLVGERGFRLSGGQRQRLSLARALLQRPQLLILDEATSALDSLSEARILDTIKQISDNITVLSVAHRLSSIRDADEIVVLDQGRVRERGSHHVLMRHGGLYAALWQRQAMQTVK